VCRIGKGLKMFFKNQKGKKMNNKIYLAESDRHPGVYAVENYEPGQMELTRNIEKAMKFDSKADCSIWCDQHPAFSPSSKSIDVEQHEIEDDFDDLDLEENDL